jgi:transposase, IS30 family
MPTPPMPVEQRELIHCLLRRGEHKAVIAARAGVSTRTVYRMLASLGGVPRPVDAEYDSRYLSLDERREIARLHDLRWSVRKIAHQVGRAPSTISRELHRNRHAKTGLYLPEHADTQAWVRQRRPKTSKIAGNPRLRAWVRYMLRRRLSPEQIAGRLPVRFPHDESMRISHETIYQSLYVYPRGELTRELKVHLRSGRTARRPRGQRGASRQPRIANMVSIHDRPEEVEGRLVPGHHEGDLIKGSLASNSAVGTIVERHSGFVSLIHLPEGWTADKVAAGVCEQMSALPTWFAKTLTWDRGIEMARHADITATTGIAVYFADPRCPQQRPSNENTNGLLRQYMPKGTDLSVHTRADLDVIAEELNNRPRKRLDFLTPAEVFAKLLHEDDQPGVATTP